MPEQTPKMLRITLVKSGIGYSERHKATLRALGLRRLHQTVVHMDCPALQPAITARLLQTLPVADLTVEDPPIEAVIDQIYTEGAA